VTAANSQQSDTVWLLDVNVLIALCWPSHMHHQLVHHWFFANAQRHWGSCALTELCFVRLSSNPQFSPDAVPPLAAVSMLGRVRAMTQHSFCAVAPSLAGLDVFAGPHLVGHRQVTDLYLLSTARDQGWRLATLDRGLHALAKGLAWQDSIEWIGPL
jgi:toxin-antitoxin system PIN domain toxin